MKKLLLLAMLSASIAWGQGTDDAGWRFDAAVGPDLHGGDLTYRIGGTLSYAGGSERVGFPISELVFPEELTLVTVMAHATKGDRWSVDLRWSTSVTDDSGTLTDSDWDRTGLIIYSECDTTADFSEIEGAVRRWFPVTGFHTPTVAWALGAGVLRRRTEWTGGSGWQWDAVGGDVSVVEIEPGAIVYEAEWVAPYLDASLRWRAGRLAMESGLGLSPYAWFSDEDNHVSRQIRTTMDASGYGWMAHLGLQYDLPKSWFVALDVRAIYLYAEGESDTVSYGDDPSATVLGGRWTIDKEVENTSFDLRLTAGRSF